jgi:hypothetical protein
MLQLEKRLLLTALSLLKTVNLNSRCIELISVMHSANTRLFTGNLTTKMSDLYMINVCLDESVTDMFIGPLREHEPRSAVNRFLVEDVTDVLLAVRESRLITDISKLTISNSSCMQSMTIGFVHGSKLAIDGCRSSTRQGQML